MPFDPNKLAATKQKKSGFDPNRLNAVKQSAPAAAPEEQGVIGKTLDVLGTPGRGIAALAYGAGQIGQQSFVPTVQKMAEITQPGFEPQNLAEQSANAAGTLTNLAVPVGAALTGAKKAASAAKLGTVAKGLLSSVQKSGKAISKIEEGAGLLTGKPTTSIRATTQDIIDTSDLVKGGLKQNTPEFAQSLKDMSDKAGAILDKGKRAVGGKNYALLSKAKEDINVALNELIPGRADAQLAARAGYLRNNLLKGGIVLGAAEKGRQLVMDTLRGR